MTKPQDREACKLIGRTSCLLTGPLKLKYFPQMNADGIPLQRVRGNGKTGSVRPYRKLVRLRPEVCEGRKERNLDFFTHRHCFFELLEKVCSGSVWSSGWTSAEMKWVSHCGRMVVVCAEFLETAGFFSESRKMGKIA